KLLGLGLGHHRFASLQPGEAPRVSEVAPAEKLARRDTVLPRHQRNAPPRRLSLGEQPQLLRRRVATPPFRARSTSHCWYSHRLVRLLFHGLTRFLPRSALSDPSGGYSKGLEAARRIHPGGSTSVDSKTRRSASGGSDGQ